MKDLIDPLLHLRKTALWPLPIVDAILLSVLWILFMVLRKRESTKKFMLVLLWLSCIVAAATVFVLYVVVNTASAVAPIYKHPVKMEINMRTWIATCAAAGLHLVCVIVATWYDKHVDGSYGLT
jgi:hypothetical protein